MTFSIFQVLAKTWLKAATKLTLDMMRVAKFYIDSYNNSVHRFAGHSKIQTLKCSRHFGGLVFP